MSERYRGLVAAPFTPFHQDHSLNLGAIAPYARFLCGNGVSAAFVCGTTGEGFSMSREERLSVVEHWVGQSSKDFRIIVHVGHTSLVEACVMAAHATSVGAAAVSAMAPCFFKPARVKDLVDWCREIALSGAPLPFYYYHIPSMNGVLFPMAEFLELAAREIPTLAGIKFTYEDIEDYARCVSFQEGRFDIAFGRDELLLTALGRGMKGAIGSTYSYAAPLYWALIEAHRRGDQKEANRLQEKVVGMIRICNGMGVSHLAASKALMAGLGVDCGPVRLPLCNLPGGRLAALEEQLEEIGFSEFACKSVKECSEPSLA